MAWGPADAMGTSPFSQVSVLSSLLVTILLLLPSSSVIESVSSGSPTAVSAVSFVDAAMR